MESRMGRLERLEERMDMLEKENTGLKKEILSLKKENINYQEELMAVKSRMDSLDRKFRIKSEQETTSSTSQRPEFDGDLSRLMQKIQVSSNKVGLTGNPRATTMMEDFDDTGLATIDVKDTRLASLEQQFHDLGLRLKTLESIQDMKKRSIFNVSITHSTPLSSNEYIKLDEWIIMSESPEVWGECVDFKTCVFQQPWTGFYGLCFEFHVENGEVEACLIQNDGSMFYCGRSYKNEITSERYLEVRLVKGDSFHVVARSVSGHPKVNFSISGKLIEPLSI